MSDFTPQREHKFTFGLIVLYAMVAVTLLVVLFA